MRGDVARRCGNAISATWWPKLELTQVAPPGGVSVGHHLLAKLGTNTSDATFKLISVRKMIQDIDAMPWVRCASGNVFVFLLACRPHSPTQWV